MDGLICDCKLDIPLSTFLELQDNLGGTGDGESSSGSGTLRDAFILFSNEVLVSWNLETETGKKIPADQDGFFTLPPVVASRIMSEYFSAVSDVPAPLDTGSEST